jgi:uncharacterized protein (DUF4415 family)
MLRTTKTGRVIEMPGDEEDERINAGIAADDDTYELSAAEFLQLKRDGRPVAEVTKARITIRVDKETLNVFKAKAETTGGNYQTLMNEVLRQYALHELAH